MIIYATGFDAVVGPLARMDIRGVGGQPLSEKWANGPVSFLGMQTSGFPNLLIVGGPNSSATLCNVPRCIEDIVGASTALIAHANAKDHRRFDVTEAAEQAWTQQVLAISEMTMASKVDSWFTGVNTNIDGRQQRRYLLYPLGAVAYRAELDSSAAAGYPQMTFA
jgi:cation diffusion facilitator CzcD-associated flavoprotein CzcO